MGGRGVAAAATAALVLVAAPGSARASEASVEYTTGPQSSPLVIYDAATGERNRLTVRHGRDGLVIVDRGARRIRAGRGCRARGSHKVVCDSAPPMLYLEDRDDVVHLPPGKDSPDPPRTNPFTLEEDDLYYSDDDDEGAVHISSYVAGGRGNDLITGSRGDDVLDPGPGRDRAYGRGGRDTIVAVPDGAHDTLRTGGGIDSLVFEGRRPVHVDLAAGTAGAGGENDEVAGAERVHGTAHGDTLVGSDRSDALYGDGGPDVIDGGAGNDLLTGNRLQPGSSSHNTMRGGAGDDVIDARGTALAPTTTIDCGEGMDVEAGEIDDLLAPGCESVAFQVPYGRLTEDPYYDAPVAPEPASYSSDGSPIFTIRCPRDFMRCTGSVRVGAPPRAGGSASRESYGRGAFDLTTGAQADVEVPLSASGHAAVAAGSPVAVRVKAQVGDRAQPAGTPADFGWQVVLRP